MKQQLNALMNAIVPRRATDDGFDQIGRLRAELLALEREATSAEAEIRVNGDLMESATALQRGLRQLAAFQLYAEVEVSQSTYEAAAAQAAEAAKASSAAADRKAADRDAIQAAIGKERAARERVREALKKRVEDAAATDARIEAEEQAANDGVGAALAGGDAETTAAIEAEKLLQAAVAASEARRIQRKAGDMICKSLERQIAAFDREIAEREKDEQRAEAARAEHARASADAKLCGVINSAMLPLLQLVDLGSAAEGISLHFRTPTLVFASKLMHGNVLTGDSLIALSAPRLKVVIGSTRALLQKTANARELARARNAEQRSAVERHAASARAANEASVTVERVPGINDSSASVQVARA